MHYESYKYSVNNMKIENFSCKFIGIKEIADFLQDSSWNECGGSEEDGRLM